MVGKSWSLANDRCSIELAKSVEVPGRPRSDHEVQARAHLQSCNATWHSIRSQEEAITSTVGRLPPGEARAACVSTVRKR